MRSPAPMLVGIKQASNEALNQVLPCLCIFSQYDVFVSPMTPFEAGFLPTCGKKQRVENVGVYNVWDTGY